MTERTYTADEVDAMFAKTLHFAQWTNRDKDLSNYILVGQLTLAGIENGKYGTSEIKPLDNTIDALQERLITGAEHKWVPLLAYIGGLNTNPPSAQRQFVGLTDEDKDMCVQATIQRGSVDELIAAIEAKLKEKNT